MKDCLFLKLLQGAQTELLESTRLIKRYELNKLQVKIELSRKPPTLVERTLCYRLSRLVQVIHEISQFCKQLTEHLNSLLSSVEDGNKKLRIIFYENILNYSKSINEVPLVYKISQISKFVSEACQSSRSEMPRLIRSENGGTADQDNSNSNSNMNMEIFICELHVLIECLLECLCYFTLNFQKQLPQFLDSPGFTSNPLSSLLNSSQASATSVVQPLEISSLLSSDSVQVLIDNLLEIESHLPMKYNDQYNAARVRLSMKMNI
ncbi:unnamed protein product [Heterobilharzia americana]|nr:unnamed protein product [Heterobilharzia americana]